MNAIPNSKYSILETLTRGGVNFQPLKGPPLAVFLCIALYANQQGATWPSHKLISHQTGYCIRTVSLAICNLCKLKINGKRLLLHYQSPEIGAPMSNRYLLFPSQAEIDRYE